jgi:hypothetical protein
MSERLFSIYGANRLFTGELGWVYGGLMDASGVAYWLFDDEERHARRAAKILLHIFHPLFNCLSTDRMLQGKFLFGYSGSLLHYPPQVAGDFLARN